MLRRRLISAAVIITVMLLIVGFDHFLGRAETWNQPGLLLACVTSLATLLAACELVQMWRSNELNLSYRDTLIGGVLLCLGACLPILWPRPWGTCPLGSFGGTLFGLSAAIGWCCLAEMFRFDGHSGNLQRLSRLVFCFSYLAMFIGLLAPHRLLPGIDIGSASVNSAGLVALLAILVTVKFSDTFAYAFGKLWGRRKLAPLLSPNKTWEGVGGSFAGALVGAILTFYVIGWAITGTFLRPFGWVLIYGIVVAIAGICGDLAESLIKRDAQCKDSSGWLPGLGGILDILDSLIFAAPASFLVWVLF